MKTIDEPAEKSFSEILQAVLSELDITLYKMQKDTKLGTGPLARMLSGETPNPGRETIRKILNAYPELNPEFMLFGRGNVKLSGNAKPVGVFGNLV